MSPKDGRSRLFLLEIGTEEIPARMVRGALRDLVAAAVAFMGKPA